MLKQDYEGLGKEELIETVERRDKQVYDLQLLLAEYKLHLEEVIAKNVK
ncbi:hypothetical protein [Enterococcus faecalis]|nr:hypothetical protein [Enterococcus faecalis]MUN52448.1 hypothetical protein [Enterococcus faecalis]